MKIICEKKNIYGHIYIYLYNYMYLYMKNFLSGNLTISWMLGTSSVIVMMQKEQFD